MRLSILFSAAAACGGAAAPPVAAPAAPPPTPCPTVAHYHDFDFWLGSWEVTGKAGRVVGRNEIAQAFDGCAITEAWTGTTGGDGGSYNFYDPARKKWREVWVDRGGEIVEMEGGLIGGSMILVGPHTMPDGTVFQTRGTWTPNADGSVRQLFEDSKDGGATWTVSFDGHYVKRQSVSASQRGTTSASTTQRAPR
jgi:hypothetical protein